MRRIGWTTTALMLLPLAGASGQTREDSVAIRATAEDYIVSWYDGDAARMERAVHPELAKRQISTMDNGRSRFNNMGAMALVQLTRSRAEHKQPADQRMLEITIVATHRSNALVKIVSQDFVDLVAMAKSDGRWVVVNDLWDRR
jgi:Putative lumazine-binding